MRAPPVECNSARHPSADDSKVDARLELGYH